MCRNPFSHTFRAKICLLFILSLVSIAELEASSWTAEWITADPVQSPRNTNLWLAFRQTYMLEAVPAEAIAQIAVDSKYWLWVNGQMVTREGGLKRGPTPEGTYFDSVDLTPWLQPGENLIAISLWFWGKDGFSHKNSGQAGLLFEAKIGQDSWHSDSSWKAIFNPAFGETGEPLPNYRLPECNIHYDAQLSPGEWQKPGFDDSGWSSAITVGSVRNSPWGDLIPRPIPQWKDSGLQTYPDSPVFPIESDGTTLSLSLPYNAQITPWLDIEAPAGKTIYIRTDNYRGGSVPNVRTEYVTTEGRQTFESPGWMNGHTVEYTFPPGVTVHSLMYRESGYNADFVGSFECDDPALNQLWQEAARTLYITMRDNYMDCPDRERAQWWGDAVIELGEAFYALDRRSDALARKGFLELFNWQKEDGALFSPVPAGNWKAELPTQMLATIGWYGIWTYYLHSGDIETTRRAYPHIKRYLELWGLNEGGLVESRKGDWTWGDWGKNKDLPLLFNCWYLLALRAQKEMATLCEQTHDLDLIESRIRSIEKHFNARFWQGEVYRSPDYEELTDDRGHGLAVLAGLATAEQYPAIRQVLAQSRHASPYMEKYILEALLRMGYVDDALARMKSRYSRMLEDSLSTLYEGWGIGAEGYGGGTYNHAWSGGPLTLLSQYIAGVEPLTPGYDRFKVQPRLGPLKHVSARIPSAKGLIDLKISVSGKNYRMRLSVPDNSIAEVHLPEGKHLRIRHPAPEAGTPQFDPQKTNNPLIVSTGIHEITLEIE